MSGDAGMAVDGTSCGLGRGISFGNALDAVREGDAGFRLRERYFAEVRDAGFDTVRLPVKWSAHADESSPYRSPRKEPPLYGFRRCQGAPVEPGRTADMALRRISL